MEPGLGPWPSGTAVRILRDGNSVPTFPRTEEEEGCLGVRVPPERGRGRLPLGGEACTWAPRLCIHTRPPKEIEARQPCHAFWTLRPWLLLRGLGYVRGKEGSEAPTGSVTAHVISQMAVASKKLPVPPLDPEPSFWHNKHIWFQAK